MAGSATDYREMRNEIDTFGLIETGGVPDTETDSETSDEDWDY